MERKFYLDLAARGLRMPIGAHLVLHETADPDVVVFDGERLGAVVVETARRFKTPLAVPLMDLMVEKTALLEMLDIPADQIPTFHFESPPDDEALARVADRLATHRSARLEAATQAISHVARKADLLPIGMAIGPFSLMVRLVRDPITAVFMAGRGQTAAQNQQVAMVERTLELATRVIEWSLQKQVDAGARAVVICEPAASTAYISPRQMTGGADTFDRYVMHFNRRLKSVLDQAGADLIFHCCGEITDEILKRFVELDPAILSLGGSRKLWEDAALVPKTTVLFGNLPSKKFFSDSEITRAEVERQARELIRAMRRAGHPFILGTECDVLSVVGCRQVIVDKVNAFVDVPCDE
jgi:uroporphyrinogen-III decarboxylase